MKPKILADSMHAAAAMLQIPYAQVRRAKADGCPAFVNGRVELAGLRAWLRAHKAKPPKPQAPPASTEPMGAGAGAALRRLEQAEVAAYQQMQATVASGDIDATEFTRRAWLRTSEQLRKTDLAIEESRRAAGSLIERGQVEHALHWLGYSFRVGLGGAIPEAARQLAGTPDLPGAVKILEQVFLNAGLVSFGAITAKNMSVPQWILDAFFSDLKSETGATSTDLERWKAAIEQTMEFLAGQILPEPSTEPKL